MGIVNKHAFLSIVLCGSRFTLLHPFSMTKNERITHKEESEKRKKRKKNEISAALIHRLSSRIWKVAKSMSGKKMSASKIFNRVTLHCVNQCQLLLRYCWEYLGRKADDRIGDWIFDENQNGWKENER